MSYTKCQMKHGRRVAFVCTFMKFLWYNWVNVYYSIIILSTQSISYAAINNVLRLRLSRCRILVQHGNDEVVFWHEVVLCNKHGETTTQVRLRLEMVKYLPEKGSYFYFNPGSYLKIHQAVFFLLLPMMEVSMREDPVDPPAHWPKFGHGRLLDGDPAGKILVAVEEAGGSVQGVSGVVYCRTLQEKGLSVGFR